MALAWALPQPVGNPWRVRVDGGCLCELADRGDRAQLEALRLNPREGVPATWRHALLLHPESAADRLPRIAPRALSADAQRLVEALGDEDTGGDLLYQAWNGSFRRRATSVGHRFDLYADYLASAREFVLTSVLAVPAALPPSPAVKGSAERFLVTFAAGIRHGAMTYADRDLYRLTKQMVREGVLTWRDERGRVQEHPCLRTQQDDPAPLVSEREFRREVKTFVARYGPRLLGWKVWERFRLHYFEGKTQGEIAALHGVSQQAVSESLATAAVRLRQAFEDHRRQE